MKRQPPYAKRVVPSTKKTLHILTGSKAWDRANSPTWFPASKVVLPSEESPHTFDWSFTSKWGDAVIWCLGDPAPQETIQNLAVELLQRLDLVLYVGPKQSTVRFTQRRRAAA